MNLEVVRISRKGEVRGSVEAPPSKSYTHRAIAIAMLAEGTSEIRNASLGKDVLATLKAAELFGSSIKMDNKKVTVEGIGRPRAPDDVIDAMNSGTTLRIMTAIAGLVKEGYTVLTGDESLRRRPMQPLLDAMNMLGVRCFSTKLNGCAPIVVEGGEMGGECSIRGDVSSQFVSGLLIAGARTERGLKVNVTSELVSKPYVDATLTVQKLFGSSVERVGYREFVVKPIGYSPSSFDVPGDYGLAAFILAAPYFAGGRVEVSGLDPALPQADSLFLDVLREMGGYVEVKGKSVIAKHSHLKGIKVDLRDAPDLLPVIAVLACVAEGTTKIKGVSHARYKESDRLKALVDELRKLGISVNEEPDGLVVRGGKMRPARLDSRNDHRLFMAFAALSLAVEGGLEVTSPSSAEISYPGFLSDLRKIGAEVSE